VKRLLTFALIAALPAAALSLKDWEATSLQQQQDYLAECLIRLTAIVKKTDPALEQRISDYYTGLAAPWRYQEGKLDVLQRIGQLQGRA
jgi:hypothetical protein